MASPSDHPKKDGIRCDGIYAEGHKFAGETCNALLFEKDPEQGLGARCGRCGTFHTLDELSHKVKGVQPDSAAHDQIQPQTQRRQGDDSMARARKPRDGNEERGTEAGSLRSKTEQFRQVVSTIIAKTDDKEKQTNLFKAKEQIDIDKIERIFSVTNLSVEEVDISRHCYHSGSGVHHILTFWFRPKNSHLRNDRSRVVEISLENNDLFFREDGPDGHDWCSLFQISRWEKIEYDEYLGEMMFVVSISPAQTPHVLDISDDGTWGIYSMEASGREDLSV